MNILPKKRWHVRNRENIARVRKDEAKAKQEAFEKEQRKMVAEREARTNLLRQRVKTNVSSKDFIALSTYEDKTEPEHINFFSEVEDGHEESNRSNKQHEIEEKNEREKYEKQIGYLTYLGQDTNEILGKKNWYDEIPTKRSCGDDGMKEEVNLKNKLKEDPVEMLKKYGITKLKKVSTKEPTEFKNQNVKNHYDSSIIFKRKKHKKKRSKQESDSDDVNKKRKLDSLRQERLRREEVEKKRSSLLLAEMNAKRTSTSTENRKYNSQFNPEIAKQNFFGR